MSKNIVDCNVIKNIISTLNFGGEQWKTNQF